MSLAEERRDERQTFELEAKRVKNRRQVRSKVPLPQRLEIERRGNSVQENEKKKKLEEITSILKVFL